MSYFLQSISNLPTTGDHDFLIYRLQGFAVGCLTATYLDYAYLDNGATVKTYYLLQFRYLFTAFGLAVTSPQRYIII